MHAILDDGLPSYSVEEAAQWNSVHVICHMHSFHSMTFYPARKAPLRDPTGGLERRLMISMHLSATGLAASTVVAATNRQNIGVIMMATSACGSLSCLSMVTDLAVQPVRLGKHDQILLHQLMQITYK